MTGDKLTIQLPLFFADDSDEPTIVWVRPPRRRLRGFTPPSHFLTRQSDGDFQEGEATADEAPTEPETEAPRFDEDTRV